MSRNSHTWRGLMALMAFSIGAPAVAGIDICKEPEAQLRAKQSPWDICATLARLDVLLQNYTDKYPDVVATRASLLDHGAAVLLVRKLEWHPGSPSATVLVLKSWKGPFSPGRLLHVEPPAVHVGPAECCKPYIFQRGDNELVIFTAAREPIVLAPDQVFPATQSQLLMQSLDQAVRDANATGQ